MGSMPQPYPPLPASPTLTNPDMILPDYDRADSPETDEGRSQSPLMMWKNAHAAASGSDLAIFNAPSSTQHSFIAGPITPTTPIIYGNGTMLSDIGEVTEAESTPGKPSPQRRRGVSPLHVLRERENLSEVTLRSSPTIPHKGVKMLAKEQASQEHLRRSSIDSTSTITTQGQAGLFADFDDTISVGDSVFQGDDEESVAESYIDELPVRSTYDTSTLTVPEDTYGGSGGSSGNTSDNGHKPSTTTLSRQAERILADAKQRLAVSHTSTLDVNERESEIVLINHRQWRATSPRLEARCTRLLQPPMGRRRLPRFNSGRPCSSRKGVPRQSSRRAIRVWAATTH